jgi:hypothetical protein
MQKSLARSEVHPVNRYLCAGGKNGPNGAPSPKSHLPIPPPLALSWRLGPAPQIPLHTTHLIQHPIEPYFPSSSGPRWAPPSRRRVAIGTPSMAIPTAWSRVLPLAGNLRPRPPVVAVVGRGRRVIPTAIREAIRGRDAKCRCHLCEQSALRIAPTTRAPPRCPARRGVILLESVSSVDQPQLLRPSF